MIQATARKTVFLDRDGVINKNRPDHVKDWSEFQFIKGAPEAIARLTQHGYRVVVVSNQAIVNRGLASQETVDAINERMRREVARVGGHIDAVFYCPHSPEESCACRKPRSGLFRRAVTELGVDLDGAYYVGDWLTDIDAAHAVGCSPILVLTGRGLRALFSTEGRRRRGYHVARSLKHAVQRILEEDAASYYGARRLYRWARSLAKTAWQAGA